MKYQYLFFDLDGTLTDSGEGIIRSVQYALHKLGIEEPDLLKLREFVGPPLVPTFMRCYGFSREKADQAVAAYRERYKTKGMYENAVYEGLPQVLEQLVSQGRILAVASSKPEPFVRQIMDHFDLSRYFTDMIGSTLDGRLTEKPEVIEETIRRLGLPDEKRGSVLMIGDRSYDIKGARQCHLDSLGVYYGFAEKGELEEAGADYIVQSVAEMGELLVSL